MQDQPIKKTSLQATVFDPAPPVRLRPLPLWLVPLALLFLFASVWLTGPVASALLTAMVTGLALAARPRARARNTHLLCKPGSVRLGARGPVLLAREIVGATTARHDGRVSLVLEHARRKRKPVILSLEDDAALRTVCDSLGIGHHGFGIVDATTVVPPVAGLRAFLSAATLLGLLAAILGTPFLGQEFLGLMTMLVTLGAFTTGIAFLSEIGSPRAVLRLTSQGVFIPTLTGGSTFVPFLGIERVDVTDQSLALTVMQNGKRTPIFANVRSSRWVREGLSAAELAHVASQIRSASERAHGRFALKDEPSSSVELLRRQGGESLRGWFSRLDTLGTGSAGYRTTSLESADLWKVLEDPDAEADLRSAAARVLSRRAEVKTRVGDVLATVRDERVRARIAASMDDQLLAQEEELEAVENKKRRAGA